MQITANGLKKPEVQEINIESFGDNVDILDQHLSDTDIHVNAAKIAEIEMPENLSQIDITDTNSTMWGKIKKSISEVTDHVDKVASETTLGHIKIGTGLQMTEDVANVKIANDLVTDDSTTALSAAMGVELNNSLTAEDEIEWTYADLQEGKTKVFNWSDFRLLCFKTGEWFNVRSSACVPSSYFDGTTPQTRVILTYGSSMLEVYKVSNTEIAVKTTNLATEQRLKVYGLIMK